MATLAMNDLSFYEPMRRSWFVVKFDSGLEDGESLTIACKTCDLPKMTTDPQVIDRINDKVYVPGKTEYSEINLSFYEYIKGKDEKNTITESAGKILYDWQQKVHDPKSGAQGTKTVIARNMAVAQIGPSGEIVRTWNVYHCWPTTVEFASLDSSSGELQDVTVTLRYDWASMDGDINNTPKTTTTTNADSLV